uniref:Uncharacterized protein n=1 Tax=Arundo donax TaxID=35708 RepID=A0A0A9CIX9_ARUDO
MVSQFARIAMRWLRLQLGLRSNVGARARGIGSGLEGKVAEGDWSTIGGQKLVRADKGFNDSADQTHEARPVDRQKFGELAAK